MILVIFLSNSLISCLLFIDECLPIFSKKDDDFDFINGVIIVMSISDENTINPDWKLPNFSTFTLSSTSITSFILVNIEFLISFLLLLI
ncbi:hypothetical protein HERIO_368 [Hepatospora eriocheir]|uniref:Uncharacterized protein n=1 Tax=Hepatospora eriocheir TaxID=1081669 RepID=A0A1X0QDE1_9MICR|nr:hypothetical protein HERIO_368 [Hepatospora eriocheir]